ncbi:hypothetical protein [Oscillibacter sp.]|uniref:hypothetical protein n=1 Tax=Oscillibacter sp. TaxID=1945593 RepID=UPI003FA7D98F
MSDKIIRQISTEDLQTMGGQEGLILQGCGGDLQEWLDGVNGLLTEAGILLDGSKFKTASVFQHDGLTNLLFSFAGVKLDMSRLAIWRLLVVAKSAKLRFRLVAKTTSAPLLLLSPPQTLRWFAAGAPFNSL